LWISRQRLPQNKDCHGNICAYGLDGCKAF
jgi:hypothetical protein